MVDTPPLSPSSPPRRDEAPSPDDVLRKGIEAQKAWRETEMLPLVAAALERHPHEARLHQMRALLHRGLDETEQALTHFAKARALAPENARIALGLAQTRLEAGLEAVPDYEALARLTGPTPDTTLGLVAALLASNAQGKARALLERELARDPHWVAGHAALTRLRWQAGHGPDAWQTLEGALQRAPTAMPLWRELIASLMHAKRFEAALGAIGQARRHGGADLFLASSEAGCLDGLGRHAQALQTFMAMGRVADSGVAMRFTRHLLHTGRPADAASVALQWTDQPGAQHFWPYIATAWRMNGDPRWEWLEGDERLVGVYDIGARLGSLDALARLLRRLHQSVHQPLEQSVRSGTQTNGKLFKRTEPEIVALRAAVREAVATHVAQLPAFDPRHPILGIRPPEIRFSGSWSVRLTASGHHDVHMHPEGWFSSALYIALPDDMAGQGERAGWLTLGDQPEFADAPPAFRSIAPRPGQLVLFPSTMWHGTRPITGGERMTVAFDIAPPPSTLAG